MVTKLAVSLHKNKLQFTETSTRALNSDIINDRVIVIIIKTLATHNDSTPICIIRTE